MRRTHAALAAALLLAPALARADDPVPAYFDACTSCHNDSPTALGPDLHGVVGRKAGTLDGYRFSGPMKRSGLVWTQQTLIEYLQDPQGIVPGNRMPSDGVPKDQAEQIAGFLQGYK